MARMPSQMRPEVVRIAEGTGWNAKIGKDGEDIYNKLISLESPRWPSRVYIHKDNGFTIAGDIRAIKVAVHPDYYQPDLENNAAGIEPAVNQKTGTNRHSHSGYRGFPYMEGNNEPCAKAYQVKDLGGLRTLLESLNGTENARRQRREKTTRVGTDQKTDASAAASTTSTYSKDPSTPISHAIPVGQAGEPRGISRKWAVGAPSKGLVIDTPWIDLILQGRKTWEMRSKPTAIRGPIALIKKASGLIVGVASLVGVRESLSRDELQGSRDFHCIASELLRDDQWMDRWNNAWMLEDVYNLPEPVPYSHPKGAVIWVALSPGVIDALDRQLGIADGSNCES